MKEIKLLKGDIAIVDDADYDYLSQFKWYSVKTGNTFYAKRVDGNKRYFMHREILNAPNDKIIDHKDHNGLNNQRNNIRLCNKSENTRNMIRNNKDIKSSKYLGVSVRMSGRLKGQILAFIKVNYKNVYLGSFKSELDAAMARDVAAIKYHGDFARLNFSNNK